MVSLKLKGYPCSSLLPIPEKAAFLLAHGPRELEVWAVEKWGEMG
jgi:hypothetical protein